MRIASSLSILVISTGLASAATLDLNIAAELYEGGANFVVLADGQQIGKGTAQNPDGETFSFEFPDEATSIGIRFTNDAAGPKDQAGNRAPGTDRNLVIISAGISGQEWSGIEFVGESTSARDQRLVLFNNTTATLQIAAPEVAQQSACDLTVEVTNFSSGIVNLSADQQTLLVPVLEKENCNVTVTGYSSTSGPSYINDQVALDRAQKVLDYLIAQGGDFSTREAISGGETDQFGSAQADNRRVVVQTK
ncbi:carbohydrate-binding domain-containing protein [Devosia submarina]|uniref:carbohydrate-binding domain-containing protein n=1 Tax=Devosia submarina TaxID=1173082 RepID=UPI001474D303|nr:carbohydrate-binding domain-containing protein [Devosia submarina]